MNKDNTKNTFHQYFYALSQLNQRLKPDRYVKKLKTMPLIKLLSFAQLQQEQGLRSISSSLNSEYLSRELGLDSI